MEEGPLVFDDPERPRPGRQISFPALHQGDILCPMRTPCMAAALLAAILVGFLTGSAQGQELTAAFATELEFAPAPLALTDASFTLRLGATVADTTFLSQTQFSLLALESQLFSLLLDLGELSVTDRLLFAPGLVFERNELRAQLGRGAFHLAAEAILEELGPPSPDVNPGLVVEAGVRSALGVGLTSFTGFGTTQVVEDFTTVLPCLPLDVECLDGPRPDDRPDRLVVKPFVFTEEAVRVDIALGGVTIAATPLFTLTGFTRLFLEAEVALQEPVELRFWARSTLDPSFLLVRQDALLQVALGPVAWRAVTRFAGIPLVFEEQTFKLVVNVSGFHAFSAVIFDAGGLTELRVGLGFRF